MQVTGIRRPTARCAMLASAEAAPEPIQAQGCSASPPVTSCLRLATRTRRTLRRLTAEGLPLTPGVLEAAARWFEDPGWPHGTPPSGGVT